MIEYGVFAQMVAGGSAALAATTALSVMFLKRSRWQPPKQSVPDGVARVASLISVVFVVLIWAYRNEMGREWIAVTAVSCAIITVIALAVTIKTNTRHAYYYPAEEIERNRLLGGHALTEEANEIAARKKLGPQTLLEHAQGAKDKVWTRESQAEVQVRSTMGYIALIAAGTSGFAAIGALVATFVSSG
ncbi:hypothetical protein HMPREF0185_00441 [Brevundimonas diminuta 470-4]|nr:hypothetical protein HMPREF0185_00441 [Brevundimonas diminuta 470-4]